MTGQKQILTKLKSSWPVISTTYLPLFGQASTTDILLVIRKSF
jgi:hypothetical protein